MSTHPRRRLIDRLLRHPAPIPETGSQLWGRITRDLYIGAEHGKPEGLNPITARRVLRDSARSESQGWHWYGLAIIALTALVLWLGLTLSPFVPLALFALTATVLLWIAQAATRQLRLMRTTNDSEGAPPL